MVALYGHPSGDALGVMGELNPEKAVKRAQEYADQYQELTDYPVVPAFEIIATVASDAPGADGDYSNESDPEELRPYVDAITEAGGYAFLDLQPGRARLVDQAKRYEDLLKHPNVGLALDPEWKIGPDEVPMTNVGHVEAEEVNEVSDWLAQLVQDNDLPQKGMILHQFQQQMLRDRDQIRTDHPELSFILHADGHGDAGQKLDTWNAMREGLSPDFFMAWKNFIDEDTPMFDPPKLMRSIHAHGLSHTSNLRRTSVELEGFNPSSLPLSLTVTCRKRSFGAGLKPTVRYIRRGEIVLDYEQPNDFLRIIRSGAMDIMGPDNVLLDRRDPGLTFGYSTLMGTNSSRYRMEAVEDSLVYEMPREVFMQLSKRYPDISRFYSSQSRRIRAAAEEITNAGANTNVLRTHIHDVKIAKPRSCPPELSIREAAQRMEEYKVSSLLVIEDDELLGIITDRDMRGRVVAEGLDTARPVADVMTRIC